MGYKKTKKQILELLKHKNSINITKIAQEINRAIIISLTDKSYAFQCHFFTSDTLPVQGANGIFTNDRLG